MCKFRPVRISAGCLIVAATTRDIATGSEAVCVYKTA